MALALPIRRRTTDVVQIDPFEPLERTRSTLWSLLDMPTAGLRPMARFADGHIALADLVETDEEFVLEVELPGIDKDDIDIEVEGRRIVVTAERKVQERDGVLRRRTRLSGTLRHEVWVPGDFIERDVEATLDRGVLSVRLPKSDHAGGRHIEVK